jgi:hypothetical protein
MNEPEKLIPPHGGYRKLKSFQVAQLAYDVTVRFCDRYIDRRSRTHDQMVQAARSTGAPKRQRAAAVQDAGAQFDGPSFFGGYGFFENALAVEGFPLPFA